MGKVVVIPQSDLNKGDIVLFQAGDLVPADLKLVEAMGLEVDEFELTGEILPVKKLVDGVEGEANLYQGSKIIRGKGKGIVKAAGAETEYGRVQEQVIKQTIESNPMFRIKQFAVLGLLLPALLIAALRHGNPGIAFTVFLLLSMIIVLFLQKDDYFKQIIRNHEINNLQSRHIEVTDKYSLETLSTIDIVCFDKTGVLTSRYIEVKQLFLGGSIIDFNLTKIPIKISSLIKLACALCNDVLYIENIDQANQIDRALITFARNRGADFSKLQSDYKRIYEIPFVSDNRYMGGGFAHTGKEVYHFIKGDLDTVLKMCAEYVTASGEEKKIDGEFYRYIFSSINAINQSGDIVLGVAYCTNTTTQLPENYTFLCLLQLENPLMPGVRDVIRKLSEREIRSIILTGDRKETAGKIGEKTGISNSSNVFLTGSSIERMAWSEIARQSEFCTVFARLLPSQKGMMVRLFQQMGHRTAMVGDGPNDGIALNAADIGISFAKDSSPIARGLSKFLIHDIGDLLTLFESADRLRLSFRYGKLVRILVTAAVITGSYVWAVV
jgi:Ca2+-transporting ATPase